MARAFAKQFYSSKAWQSCRNEYIKRKHYLCEDCLKRGVYKPGEIVHHKIHMDVITIEKPELALSSDNFELLCRDCHAKRHPKKKKAKKSDRYTVDEAGRVSAR